VEQLSRKIDEYEDSLRTLLLSFGKHAEPIANEANAAWEKVTPHAQVEEDFRQQLVNRGVDANDIDIIAPLLTNHRRRFLKMIFALGNDELWTFGEVDTERVTEAGRPIEDRSAPRPNDRG